MANALAFVSQTPTHSLVFSSFNEHRPTKSSPLAPVSLPPSSSPTPASPIVEVQARRKGQYKQRTPASTTVASLKNRGRYRTAPASPIPFILGPVTAEDGQAAFLRQRFKANCLERAKRAREKDVARRRASASSDASSDGADADMMVDGEEDEADDDSGFDDELFRRVIANEKRKRAHAYALSYELDVGSSFDPELEDPASWEEDLLNSPSSRSQPRQQHSNEESDNILPPDDFEEIPDFDEFDLDEESAWLDAYIASLPLDNADSHPSAPFASRRCDVEHQQMDITMD
ncbi:hypothetical protein ACEPAF_2343 [Sanghuangporus sanghuang]